VSATRVFHAGLFVLQVPDSATIQAGTAELREAFKSANAIPELGTVLGSAADAQVRQYAALLLRKKLQRPRVWAKIPPEAQASIKDGVLQARPNLE
jgi:hypothetical protein